MAVFVDPKTGERYENVPDAEAERARAEFGLVDAEAFDRQQAIDAKPLGQKTLETVGSGLAGVAAIGNVIGDVIPEALGGYSDEEVQKFNTEFLQSPLVKGLKEEHPIAFALGSSAPAIALGPAVGAAAGGGLAGGVAGTLAESAAVGLGDEAIAAGAEGREFSEEQAVSGAQTDLAFSAAAQALLGVAGRVGNLFLFGGGNTMAKNVGRGLDETVGPVVPDDIRFESPLLEAETRSTRAAAAASPGMPPGPARDEALRRAAADLNEQVRTQGGETLETTVATARESASVADSPLVQRRIDDTLTDTTPAQTSWSADATQRLDKLRQAVAADPAAARAVPVADDAIRAIDGSGDSAEWFKASAAARDRLDAIADALPEGPAAKPITEARDWLARSLADRGMWGSAADLDASLRAAARDKVGSAARTVGGDLRGHVAAYVDADGAGRAGLRAPIDQAIEGIEELASAHERFGTATPKQIEALRENAAGLRRRIALADDVRAAEGRAAQQVAEETPAKATMVEQAAEAVASHLEKGGKAALSAGIGRALTTIADFAGIPGAGWVARKIRNKVGDAVADQVLAAAKQYDPTSPGGKRVKRIIDRMRAAERQRGAVTLGGKKAERIRTAPRDGTIGQISPDEFSIAGLNHEDLGADKVRPGVLEGLRKDEQFAKTGVPAMGGRAAAKELVIQEGKHGKPLFLNDGSHRLQVAREKGLTHLPGRVEDADGNVIFQGQIRIADPKKGASPKATGEAGFVQAAPDERQFSPGDIAKSPAGVVTGAGAAWAGINQLRRDEDLETADRVIAVDDAAQQRVRHTARVLAGLAEPPPAEGLTTALGRFGADFEDPRAAFEERKSILEKAATAPTLVYDVIGAALGDVARVSPDLFQAASQRLLEGFQYLRENLPAEVKTSMLYPTGVPPSESAMRDWATQWNTVMDPESVLDDVERGTVSHLQIRTLEGAHPDIYQAMRTEVIAEVGANFQDIPWSTKMQLDLLFQADGLAGPMFSSKAAAMIGEAMQNASQRKAPGPVDPSAGDAAADGPSGLNAIKSSVTNRGA